MTGQKRSFGRERHNAMKMAVAVVAVAGFGATWYGLAQDHPPLAGAPVDARASVTPAVTGGATPASVPTRRARTSRGS